MFAATLYAAWPLLWRDPLNLIDGLGVMSRHPTHISTLFRGEIVRYPNVPWDYIPTWILITTPPAALILAALGIGHVARLCAARRRDALANSTARFGLLALACLALPVAAVIALNSNLYHDWRHMYFLYAPLCVLAAFGLRALAGIPRPNLRAAAFALAALGIALAAVQMVRIHPYQNVYFNSMVDKSGLSDRWTMDYWHVARKEALEAMLTMQPAGPVTVAVSGGVHQNMSVISEDAGRSRLHVNPVFPSFGIGRDRWNAAVWKREVYGVPIAIILDNRAKSEAAHRAAYAAARASEPTASAGGFDIYADGGELTYINGDCGEEFARGWFAVSVFPFDQSDLPNPARDAGLEYEPIHFAFHQRGASFGGKCVIVQDLPDYAISHIETWQYIPGEKPLWSARIPVDGWYERRRRALASLSSAPAIRSDFDVYMEDGALTYVKSPCAESDARGRFFLSVFPADPKDLPQTARDAGFSHEPLNFDFDQYGAVFDGKCAIIRDLPDYLISHVETGQWTDGEGVLWSAGTLLDGYHERYRRALSSLPGEPAIRSDFDIYPQDGSLIYVKENCAEDAARGRFFLSVFPANPKDLPQSAIDAGFSHEPLNFDFSERGAGAVFDGKCVIIRALPNYPIGIIETGQFIPGEGELWSGRITVGD